jgi:type IV secretory pathway VirD2 relaxase
MFRRDCIVMIEEFEPHLGRIGGKHGKSDESYVRRVMQVAYKNGFYGGRRGGFTGARIGRGRAFGTLAGAGLFPGGQRRVIVKARIARFKHGDLGAARAHLRYIQRDGVTREGEPGQIYDRDTDEANGTVFLDRCEGDRHQFRFIVSAEDATELADLKPFVRDLMQRMEDDLGTRLDWVAVDHFNTGHPHTHIVVRGKDDQEKDLVIARDYITHGIRARARELVTLELGPELAEELVLKLGREVEVERFTRLDRALLEHIKGNYLAVSAMPPAERRTHAAHMGRLRKLEQLNLVHERQTGVWEIEPDMEARLRALGRRGDVIKTMHHALKAVGIERPAGSFAIFDSYRPGNRIVGRVAATGLADELDDRHYLVVDGIDGKVHYVDAGRIPSELVPEKGMIASIEAPTQGDGNSPGIRLRILSYLNLEKIIEAAGASWLDKELLSRKPETFTDQGFGAKVRSALARRTQWLVSRGLAQLAPDHAFRPAPDMLIQLRQRELRQAGAALSRQLGLSYTEPREGERITGTAKRSIPLASGKFTVVQMAKEFTLVPWQPSLERRRGERLSGFRTREGFEWERSRARKLGLGSP